MAKINSRMKGVNGELECRDLFTAQGFEGVYRTAQHIGNVKEGSADISNTPEVHIEVKRVENLNITKAMEQSVRDVEIQETTDKPVVFHRKNHKPWLVTMMSDDWFEFYKAYLERKANDI